VNYIFIFEKDETGAIIANFEDIGLGKKVLLRANGTSVYITQDIYLAKKRHEEYKFTDMVYIVGNEQEHHFKVLFEIFKRF
jgi:arginyl-tRNA synthetase